MIFSTRVIVQHIINQDDADLRAGERGGGRKRLFRRFPYGLTGAERRAAGGCFSKARNDHINMATFTLTTWDFPRSVMLYSAMFEGSLKECLQ
jgi:hypothetical protein